MFVWIPGAKNTGSAMILSKSSTSSFNISTAPAIVGSDTFMYPISAAKPDALMNFSLISSNTSSA